MTAKWKNSFLDSSLGSLTTPFIKKKPNIQNLNKFIFFNKLTKTITFYFKFKNSILFKELSMISLSKKFNYNMFFYTGQIFYHIKKFLKKKISINSINFKRQKKYLKKKQNKKQNKK